MMSLRTWLRDPSSTSKTRSRRRTASLRFDALEARELLASSLGSMATPVAGTSFAGSAVPIGYTPALLRTAYGLQGLTFGGNTADGSGQTIAIVDATNDPNIASDLDAFDQAFAPDSSGTSLYQQYGSASTFLKVLDQNGHTVDTANTKITVDSSGGWEREIAMDVEWAHAIAPGAKIDLIECNSAALNDMLTGVKSAAKLPGVSAVSMNWGLGEFSGESQLDGTFVTPAKHQGVTFLAPTGDQGSPGNYPAYSPNVVAIGGTSLLINSDGSYWGEGGWSGSGGGASQYAGEPAYQLTVQTNGQRSIPDVAFDADVSTGVAVYDSYGNGASAPWVLAGGTSLGTPAWAGLVSIANQGRAMAGRATLNSGTNPTEALSALYSLPASDFHDITVGSNGTVSAATGYDQLTGLGSPAANSLIPDLVNYQTGAHLIVSAQPPATVGLNKAFTVTVEAVDGSGHVLKNFNGKLTVSPLNNPGGSALGGKLTVQAVHGVATFSGLKLNKAGTDYQLQVTSGTMPTATSTAFTVGAAASVANRNKLTVTAMDDYWDDSSYGDSYSSDPSYYGYDSSYSYPSYDDSSYYAYQPTSYSYDSGYGYQPTSDYGYTSAGSSSSFWNNAMNAGTWGVIDGALGAGAGWLAGAGIGYLAAGTAGLALAPWVAAGAGLYGLYYGFNYGWNL